jgi:FKBP-type peptidyl-prolyl cis-trans isomerase FkpA
MGLQFPKKGIEIEDLIVGTGEEATRESVVAVNLREYLRRGDEVSPSPLFGTKHVIDLGRRECIAGLRYGVPGMRVGGTREITISPHLAYGEAGIPNRIPANALLRCRVELLEIRQHSALLPEDWLPGKIMMISGPESANGKQPNWQLSVHEDGAVWLTLDSGGRDDQGKRKSWKQIPIRLEAAKSAQLIREAIDLPNELPLDCVTWNSGVIDRKSCMVIEVRESGMAVLLMGVQESPAFRDSKFSRAVAQLTVPHFSPDQAST